MREQLIDKGRELFPEFGRLVALKIEWEEAEKPTEKRGFYEDELHATLVFEHATTRELFCTGDVLHSFPTDVNKRAYLHNESIEEDWTAALKHFFGDPAKALWALIVEAYDQYVDTYSCLPETVSDDIVRIVWDLRASE